MPPPRSSWFNFFSIGEKGGLVSVGYGDDDFTRLDGDEDGYEEEDDENSRQSVSTSVLRKLALMPVMHCRGLFLSKESPRVATHNGTSNIWQCGWVSALSKSFVLFVFEVKAFSLKPISSLVQSLLLIANFVDAICLLWEKGLERVNSHTKIKLLFKCS